MEKITASHLLEDVRAAAEAANAVLESEDVNPIKYAESLADLLDCFDVFDDWMTDTEGEDIPLQWTEPATTTDEESPF